MTEPARTYRVLHTSDWHIGHELFGHGRDAEHDVFLDWLLDRLRIEDADLLLVTGDIYDVANPPIAAMARLYRFLREATTQCPALTIAIIGGNHDSAARINLPSSLLGPSRVHLIGSLPRRDGATDCERLLIPLPGRDGVAVAWLAAVPYCRPGDLGGLGLPGLYAEVLNAGAEAAGHLPLILTGHLHVSGGDVSEQSERRITVGGEEAEAASLFDGRAAYIALGHLHRPQLIHGETPIRYAGSPFPLSAAERLYRHSVSIVDLGPDGAAIREEPIPRPAAFIAVPADGPLPLSDVEAAIAALELDADLPRGLQPFLEVSVLVDGPEPHLQTKILSALSGKPARLTRIVRVQAREASGRGIEGRQSDLTELKPEAVFAELFEREHGGKPPADLMQAFLTLMIDAQGTEA